MPALLGAALGAADLLQQHMDYGQRVQLALAATLAGGVYVRAVQRAFRPPGAAAVAAMLPLVALNTWMPLLFNARDELLSRCVWSLLLLWLASFKALGAACGRGPLVGSWTLPQTVLLYAMPIYPSHEAGTKKGRLADSQGTPAQAVRSFLGNTAALAVIAYMLVVLPLPLIAKYYLYCLGLYAFITFLMDGPAAVLIGLLDMQVVPPFDKPWLSTSLADFWGRRWNNTVGLTLRALVYDPVVERRLFADPSAHASPHHHHHGRPPASLKLAGLLATFAVSGIMHEVILLVLATREYVGGWWMAFFVLQAPLLVAEGLATQRMRAAGVKLPRPVGIGLTTCVLLSTAYWFWFPPLDRYTDLADRVVGAVNANVAALMGGARELAQAWGLPAALAAAGLGPDSA